MFRILFLFWVSFHPVHVSITSLDYMPESGNFRGFVRVYLDDLLLDCDCGMDQGKLIAGDETSVKLLEKYLNDKLIIQVNNKKISGEINNLNIEVSSNEVDVNLRYINNNRRKPELIIIKSLIMTDLYDDQSNMVIVKVDDFEEGVKLTSEVTERTFKVN